MGCGTNEEKDQQSGSASDTRADSVMIEQVVGLARIEPLEKIASLSVSSPGVVDKVFRLENDQIKKGDIILELKSEVVRARLAGAKSKIITQQARLQKQKSEIKEFEARLSNKGKELTRMKSLLLNGSETQQNLENVQTEFTVLQNSLEGAKAMLSVAEAELVEIYKEVALAEAELEERRVRAPFDGRLLTMEAVAGNALDVQDPFAELAADGALIARAEIDELYANKISPGQSATIRILGTSNTIASGKVIYVASALRRKSLFSEDAGDQEDRRVREIKIQLEESAGLLINSRVECIINITR